MNPSPLKGEIRPVLLNMITFSYHFALSTSTQTMLIFSAHMLNFSVVIFIDREGSINYIELHYVRVAGQQ